MIGLHGMKCRWSRATLEHGLTRPSAAWFMISDDDTEVVLPTTAAAVHLALGRQTCGDLAAIPERGGYAAWFRERQDLLPALVRFRDTRTGEERLDRYQWLGPPEPCLTAPYTKVERAGRAVTQLVDAQLAQLEMAELSHIEAVADEMGLPAGGARLVWKVDVDGASPPPSTSVSKLAEVCRGIAALLCARLELANATVRSAEGGYVRG